MPKTKLLHWPYRYKVRQHKCNLPFIPGFQRTTTPSSGNGDFTSSEASLVEWSMFFVSGQQWAVVTEAKQPTKPRKNIEKRMEEMDASTQWLHTNDNSINQPTLRHAVVVVIKEVSFHMNHSLGLGSECEAESAFSLVTEPLFTTTLFPCCSVHFFYRLTVYILEVAPFKSGNSKVFSASGTLFKSVRLYSDCALQSGFYRTWLDS